MDSGRHVEELEEGHLANEALRGHSANVVPAYVHMALVQLWATYEHKLLQPLVLSA